MKLIAFLLLFSITISAQQTVNVYTERKGPNVSLYADNDEVIPMTVFVELDITGMKSTLDNNKGAVVVPPKTKKFLLTTASPSPRSREMTFGMNSETYEGDMVIPTDKEYNYSLPFEEDKKVQVYQGYNGTYSHKGKKAIDFGLNIGDKVFAARGGIVYKVEERFSKACPDESCKEYNNYVIIYHEDGTFAEYVHLKKDGASVNVGDTVGQGDLIGYSGNTGWSSGPHLHFMVYRMTKEGDRESFKTRFSTEKENSIFLKEKEFYKK